jgi:hypothetical protein
LNLCGGRAMTTSALLGNNADEADLPNVYPPY